MIFYFLGPRSKVEIQLKGQGITVRVKLCLITTSLVRNRYCCDHSSFRHQIDLGDTTIDKIGEVQHSIEIGRGG